MLFRSRGRRGILHGLQGLGGLLGDRCRCLHLDVEDEADSLLLDPVHHRVEELIALALVFDERIALRHGARAYFDRAVIEQAEEVGRTQNPEKDFETIAAKMRERAPHLEISDMSDKPFVTIDPVGAGDLDDELAAINASIEAIIDAMWSCKPWAVMLCETCDDRSKSNE